MRVLRTAALLALLPLPPSFLACSDDVPGAPAPNGNGAPTSEAAADPLVSPTSPTEDSAGVDNSQTGSIGASPEPECQLDSDCIDSNGHGPTGSVELVGAECNFVAAEYDTPTCECSMRLTLQPMSDAGTAETREYPAHPGNRRNGCSELSRAGDCLYCENEFPGCDIADPQSCDAVCADMAERQNRDHRKSYQVSTRLARCVVESNNNVCRVVTEIDGQCYAGRFGSWLPAPLDCGLPDAELLARSSDRASAPCQERPAVSCARAEDCPGGLACAGGACTICGSLCQTGGNDGEAESCEGGGTCAGGETCVGFTCVPDANLTCTSFTDCGRDHQCLVTGVSSTGRGNENTRSFCE